MTKNYFTPEHLGRTVHHFAEGLGVEAGAVRMRVVTVSHETIETVGFAAEDEWIEFATPDKQICVLPYHSILRYELYVGVKEKPPFGFTAPSG